MNAEHLDLPDAPPGVPLAVRWDGADLYLLDQRRLPAECVEDRYTRAEDVFDAIAELRVRGAPAIGIAAAFGLVLAMRPEAHQAPAEDTGEQASEKASEAARWGERLDAAARHLASARPTAVNLAWALERCAAAAHEVLAQNGVDAARTALQAEAEAVLAEDRAICRAIARHGLALVPDGARVLTHCNAGSLAVSAWGTATAPIYAAAALGRKVKVYADETRPVLQGARLTAFELHRAGIDVTLITDNMAAHMMATGEIDLVIVGTDRVTANGDVVNKIGTHGVAVLARHFGIPFWVACPSSTYDARTATGADVPIEERAAEEVTTLGGVRTAPEGVAVRNPAFDVTPADLVTGIVTDRGCVQAPLGPGLAALLSDAPAHAPDGTPDRAPDRTPDRTPDSAP